ncbi:MAG: hypothetical protein R6V85_14130 [Polyangia bacterium]
MSCGFACWFKALFFMALLFGAIGAMGAYWYFFWQNRNMAPCAPVANDGSVMDEGAEVVQPYSDDLIFKRTMLFGAVGALIGIGIGTAVVGPHARRLRRFERDE